MGAMGTNSPETLEKAAFADFIREAVDDDLASGKHERVVTRFPPEPNGHLHIGHAKAICLNFGVAEERGGTCHLRFDDTNPEAEEEEFVNGIRRDIHWLGFDWGEHEFYASDYYDQLHRFAVELIEKGLAYVCDLSIEAFKEYRGVPTEPGKESPSRNRTIAENLELFERMKAGEFDEGDYVLRAKIDMSSPNLHLRDPVIYRVKKATHHRTGDEWCIYPMYDFAHGQSDAIEGITHSLCTLEFEVHRPLYDWLLENLSVPARPRQIEFARLNLTYTVMSKRLLQQLVEEGIVGGWDDPRLPTLAGLRRRGIPPAAIRRFCETIGVTKYDGQTDVALLEHGVRDELNRTAPRRMAILRPLHVTIENFPEGETEYFDAVNNPEDAAEGSRRVPFTRELYIERDDFMEDPPKKFFRLAPGSEVRLKYACLVTCTDVVRDETSGEIAGLLCRWDPDSRGGSSPDGRKVRGTIHWASADHAADVEVRLYDRLFTVEKPLADKASDFREHLNTQSLESVRAKAEPSLEEAEPGSTFQFERLGYFCADTVDSAPGAPVFNQVLPLRDGWSKRKA
jgi:glutaminyl-tRNA synthetase